MKSFLLLFICCTGSFQLASAQDLISSYRPKNKTEKLIIAKVCALPEVKEWFKTAKKSEPDIMISLPGSTQKYYWFQIGLSNLGMFRTNYHLFVDPKTYQIFYLDFFDESGYKPIALGQWRHWRSNPGFFKAHRWKAGKLVVLKDDKEKSGK